MFTGKNYNWTNRSKLNWNTNGNIATVKGTLKEWAYFRKVWYDHFKYGCSEKNKNSQMVIFVGPILAEIISDCPHFHSDLKGWIKSPSAFMTWRRFSKIAEIQIYG